MKKLFAFLTLLLLLNESGAQLNRYIVQLKHKGATTHTFSNPLQYLSQRAIDRRTRYSIAIDSTDLPVPATYITQIRNIPNVTIHNVSRWLNAVTIHTTDPAAITTINNLPFVQSTTAIAARSAAVGRNKWSEDVLLPDNIQTGQGRMEQVNDYFNYGSGASLNEIRLHKGEFLHNIGLRGQGMQIAMLDGGYFQYTTLDAFDSANANGQFLTTWDFVNREASVVEDNSHGMSCLSTIAANIPGLFIGTAPKASFHLYKTEDVPTEYPIEEFNWACAAERADSVGTDVISSSLGYGYEFNSPVPDYPYSDLNGDITMSARAADLAAKKGILVFNAAGNSGNDYWKMITTPADGDSVIAVGAVNVSGVVGSFSSYGPSADGQVKPDVAGVGVGSVIQNPNNTIGSGNGTSYACPKMAGLGTVLWQGFPEFSNIRIVRALREAGSIYTSPNDRIGFGIPDLKKAFSALLVDFASASATVNNCVSTITWTSKDVSSMKYEVERKLPGELVFTKIADIIPQPGAVLANHSYSFDSALDSVLAGTISYRVQQIIDTAASTFTKVQIGAADVTTTSPCVLDEKVIVAPNPPTGSNAVLLVQTPYDIENMTIVIYDMKGSLVYQTKQSKPSGRVFIGLFTEKLAKGKYIIRVYNGNGLLATTDLLKL
jgi:serine protease AprX